MNLWVIIPLWIIAADLTALVVIAATIPYTTWVKR